MKEITIKELLKLKKNKVQIIDIREKYEYDNGHLNSTHIPMEDILNYQDKISREKTVVIYCQSGRRAAAAWGASAGSGARTRRGTWRRRRGR